MENSTKKKNNFMPIPSNIVQYASTKTQTHESDLATQSSEQSIKSKQE